MEVPHSEVPTPIRSRRKAMFAGVAVGALMVGMLTGCGSAASSGDTLYWYINPDNGGQADLAAKCSTDQYTIKAEVLPQDASQQRIQLARRLSAKDPAIDLMSIDPPYTAEFSHAGFLAPLPADLESKLTAQSFKGAVAAATWGGKLVVAPFWSNTQVLWYRKSFAKKVGLDMTRPVTWDQLIDAASKNGGKVAVQANKYEGYSVWINGLISGAGGQLVADPQKGVNATIQVDTPAGKIAAGIIEKLSHSAAAPPDLSVSNEGTAGATFATPQGAFLVNWTYIWTNYDATQPEIKKDMGFARWPESVAGMPSRPPYGGIGIGVSAYSTHRDEAMKAVACITAPENQGAYAEKTGNMPASAAGYAYPPLAKIYPQALLNLFKESLDAAAPRSVTPYWSDISGALQSTWHPSNSVNESTPATSQTFIEDVLLGRRLL